jgi:hypothetical protein
VVGVHLLGIRFATSSATARSSSGPNPLGAEFRGEMEFNDRRMVLKNGSDAASAAAIQAPRQENRQTAPAQPAEDYSRFPQTRATSSPQLALQRLHVTQPAPGSVDLQGAVHL